MKKTWEDFAVCQKYVTLLREEGHSEEKWLPKPQLFGKNRLQKTQFLAHAHLFSTYARTANCN